MLDIIQKVNFLLKTPVLYNFDDGMMKDTKVKQSFTVVTCEMLNNKRSGYCLIEARGMSLNVTPERKDLRSLVCTILHIIIFSGQSREWGK